MNELAQAMEKVDLETAAAFAATQPRATTIKGPGRVPARRRIDVACVAAYYGRQIVDFPDDRPRCPMIMHFGAVDPLIPLDAVVTVRARYPDVPVHLYESAGHGFNCDARADYRADAAALALERTLALFARHLG
jgi:carboxymethylenebutenolidase